MNKPKVTIGILSYNDKHYLEKGLPSLLQQDYPNYELFICDNADNQELQAWLKKEFPTIKIFSAGGNVGFGRGHNHLISQSKADYYLAFNSDMYAKKDFLSNLVKEIEKLPQAGLLTGKLLKWSNFPQNPKQITENHIDTAGIIAHQNHHFTERGEGELDNNQYNNTEQIWGASGAAPLFRRKALEEIKQSAGEYFDKNFFMYKEDIDLCYRLRWAGWDIYFTPHAVAWHDRTAADPGGIITNIQKRTKRPDYIKNNSFLNHLQFTYKNWSKDYSFSTKLKTTLFFLKYFTYLIIFDRKVLKQYRTFKRLKPHLNKLKKQMPRKISPKEMQKWFN